MTFANLNREEMTIKTEQPNSSQVEHSGRYKKEGEGKTTHCFQTTIHCTNELCRSQEGLMCVECKRIQNVFKIVIYLAFSYSGEFFFTG